MLDFPDMLPWDEMTALVKRHEEQITAIQREQAELLVALGQAQEYISGLETSLLALKRQQDVLERNISDVIATLEQKMLRMVHSVLFNQVEKRLTPGQKKMFAEAQEDDCIL